MIKFHPLFIGLSIIFIFWYSTSSGQDSTLTMPLWMGRMAEADLRLKDHLDTLTQILDQENGMLRRQVANRDSVILFDKVEARAIAGLSDVKMDSIQQIYLAEKKRRKRNGHWRNIFIGTTIGAEAKTIGTWLATHINFKFGL